MATTKTAKSGNLKDRIILALICFFFGWLGIDKLYVGGLKVWKVALIKFALMFFIVGEIWNIFDIVCALLGKYKINPIK